MFVSVGANLTVRSIGFAFVICVPVLPAHAQERTSGFGIVAEEVAESRQTAGAALLAWGLAGVLTGGAVLTIDAIDEGMSDAGLASGITHASFGAINALLALGLVGTKPADRADDPLDLSQGELRSGQVFALNLGLDVAYITAGILMALGGAELGKPWMEGAGWAMTVQGGSLLVFDIWQWLASNDRAASWHALSQSQ